MHLNHYLAQAGLFSRRNAAILIKSGQVYVNDVIQKDPSYQVKENDAVKYKGRLIKLQSKIYILLNKPAGYVTTTADEMGRKTIFNLLPKKLQKGLFPVGRLDMDTTGLILLTNDGELAQKLAHPHYEIKKVYEATLDKPLSSLHAAAIKKGIKLKDSKATVDALSFPSLKNKRIVKITLHSGKKRIIRRIFGHFNYEVRKLDRINYAGLTQRGLKPGAWRYLSNREIEKIN
jgi:23S rRNA pseudouridine2605 synthase